MESARKNANHAVPNKKVPTLNRQKYDVQFVIIAIEQIYSLQ